MVLGLAGETAAAFVNGLKINERVINDFPGSTLVTTNNFPTRLDFGDSHFGVGGIANRHDALLSDDGGASAKVFGINDPFLVQTDVRLNVGNAVPRKEAGIRFNSSVTGDVLFLVNSNHGEIVASGGGAPFYIFGSNGTGDGYTPSDTIGMRMTYQPGSPGTVIYEIDRGGGWESSGTLAWNNIEGGPVDFNVGFYGLVTPHQNDPSDFMHVVFENMVATEIPEPSTLTLTALGLLVMCCRRRKRT
jgi:hypothetical protein